MHHKMEKANILFHHCNDSIDKDDGILRNCKKLKTESLNKTEPIRVDSVMVSHGNTTSCWEHGDPEQSITRTRDTAGNVSRLNVTVSLPLTHSRTLNRVRQVRKVEPETYVVQKRFHPRAQSAKRIKIIPSSFESQSDTSGDEYRYDVTLMHQLVRGGRTQDCDNLRIGDNLEVDPKYRSHSNGYHYLSPLFCANAHNCTRRAHLVKNRSVSDISTDSAYTRNSDHSQDQLTAHNSSSSMNLAVPVSTAAMNMTSFNSISRTSDLTDSVSNSSTHSTAIVSTNVSPKNSTFINSHSHAVSFLNTFDASRVTKTGRQRDSPARDVATNEFLSSGMKDDHDQPRDLVDTISSLENGEHTEELLADAELRPLLSSVLTPFNDQQSVLTPCSYPQREIMTPPMNIIGVTSRPDSGSITPCTDDHIQPENNHNSFQNIIKSIDDLEDKMAPECREDLRFLRSILENNRLSALHRVLQTVAQRTCTSKHEGIAEQRSTPFNAGLKDYQSSLQTSTVDMTDPRPPSTDPPPALPSTSPLPLPPLPSSLPLWEELPTVLPHPPGRRKRGSPGGRGVGGGGGGVVIEDLVTIKFRKVRGTLGATIVEDVNSGGIKIKRMLEDSPLAACNKIQPGDEIILIDSVPVKGKTLEEVCEMLSQPAPDCTLTVSTFGAVPKITGSVISPKSRYFRAYFNYDPKRDPCNPCPEASFSFELGDILEVISTRDEHWWHARKLGGTSGNSGSGNGGRGGEVTNVGLIPTVKQRLKNLNSRVTCPENLVAKEPKRKKKKESKSDVTEKDPKEPLTYLEVTLVKPSRKNRRPIILTGAKGYGGPCIRKLLLHNHPKKYFLARKHTTRSGLEASGYNVCSKKEFATMIKQKKFFEHSKVGSTFFGTTYDSVRELVIQGKVCLLDVHPQYLPLLCNGTLRPHVIFMECATEERMRELRQINPAELPQYQRKLHGRDIRELRFNSERLLRRYTEFVDTIIPVESLTSAADLIDQVTDRVTNQDSWMPLKWVEG